MAGYIEARDLLFLVVGLAVGLLVAYTLNLEKTAASMAAGQCGVCQENVRTMVENFNILSQDCMKAQNYKDVEILPAIGLNQSVRVYVP